MEDRHFMVDDAIIERIVNAAAIKPNETIIEIGAGHGELTELLSKRAKKVIAIEKDKYLFETLQNRFRGNKKVEIVRGNALKLLRPGKIVSNLPYSICEPLFRRLSKLEFQGFFTIPKGFSERLFQLPYSALLESETLFDIPKDAFSPKPRTQSVLLKTKPKANKDIIGLVLMQEKSKLKNAIMEAIISKKGKTKTQSKEDLKSLKISSLMEKRVCDLTSKDYKTLQEALLL